MYSLPIELGEFQVLPKDAEIDMSQLNFPTAPDIQKRSAFIFIRNTEISAKFNFSNCSYEDKAEYLLLFIKEDIRIRIHEIIKTWIKIIGWGYVDIPFESILSDDEIDRFCKENEELVFELRRFTVSIPLASMSYFFAKSDIECTDDFGATDYHGFSIANYFQLTDYEIFKELVNIITGIDPIYYNEYFRRGAAYYNDLIKRFPYLELMNIITNGDPEILKNFTDNINMYLENMMKTDDESGES